MDIQGALKRQHHAALAMLRQSITDCPDEVWVSGEHPRNFWRIAFHAAAFAHLYLYPSLDKWEKWPLWTRDRVQLDGDVPVDPAYTREQMLEFVDLIDGCVDRQIDTMDLESPTCGFAWYPNVTQVELLMLSLRHLHGHIGQLSEILLANGVEVEWLGQTDSVQ